MRQFRIVIIWASGLFASAAFGAILGQGLTGEEAMGLFGMSGGAVAFICIRLWATERSVNEPLPIYDLKAGKLQ
jgi:hypothetical protein